jgi:hypothetical protein
MTGLEPRQVLTCAWFDPENDGLRSLANAFDNVFAARVFLDGL